MFLQLTFLKDQFQFSHKLILVYTKKQYFIFYILLFISVYEFFNPKHTSKILGMRNDQVNEAFNSRIISYLYSLI